MKPLHAALLGTATVFASGLSAQATAVLNEHCGSIVDMDSTGFVRQGGVGGVVVYYAIFPRAEFRGWGHTPTLPGTARLDGIRVVLLDLDGSTPEQVDVWVYPEDPATPGSPDLASPAAGWSYPLFGSGGVGVQQAFWFDLQFPQPAFVSDSGDIFVALYLDGRVAPEVHVDVLYGDVIASRSYDIANSRVSETGHGLGVAGGYTRVEDVLAQQTFLPPAQMRLAPLVEDQAGLALGVSTNQSSLPGSAGTSMSPSFFSALHPCALEDRTAAPRTDQVGYIWNDARFTGGETVTFLMAPGGLSPTPASFTFFLAGSTGAVCLDVGLPWIEAGTASADANGEARFRVNIPSGARPNLVGRNFAFQGILLDLSNGLVHGSGCILQRW